MSYRANPAVLRDGIPTVPVEADCHLCEKTTLLQIPEREWWRFQHGILAQDSLTSVSFENRELLISGTCGKCYKKMRKELRRP